MAYTSAPKLPIPIKSILSTATRLYKPHFGPSNSSSFDRSFPYTMMYANLVHWLALAVALVVPFVTALGNVPYPQDDPFYYPAENGWQNEAPGTILRQRKIQAASLGIFEWKLDAWQVLYRTAGARPDKASYTVTTFLVPSHAHRDRVVTISSPENSNFIQCAPSYAFRKTGVLEIANFEPRWEQMLYTLFLAEGWIVNAPDHEGPESAFSAGRFGGHMVLDSMRAANNFKPLQLSSNPMHIGHGYSGGSTPNGWAASLHESYANELNVVGWSLGGSMTDPLYTLNSLDGKPTSSLVVAGAIGLMDAYRDEVGNLLDDEVWTEEGKIAEKVMRNSCVYESVIRYFGTTFQSERYIKGGRNLSSWPQMRKISNMNTMGHNPRFTPRKPIFMFHALYDEEINWHQANKTAVEWCNNGANVRFLTYSSTSLVHVTTYLLNLPYIVQYMRDRFNGKDWYGGACQFDVESQNPALDVNVLGERFRGILEAALDMLGKEIGPNDSILKNRLKAGENPNTHHKTKLHVLKKGDISPGEGGDHTKESKKAAAKFKAEKKHGKHH